MPIVTQVPSDFLYCSGCGVAYLQWRRVVVCTLVLWLTVSPSHSTPSHDTKEVRKCLHLWPETYVRQLGHCHLPVLFSQPCISVGNVGQLTVDLIINTLKLDRVGYLQDPGLLPLVGNDAFDHTTHTGQGHLHTATEGGCVYTQYPEVDVPEKWNMLWNINLARVLYTRCKNFSQN